MPRIQPRPDQAFGSVAFVATPIFLELKGLSWARLSASAVESGCIKVCGMLAGCLCHFAEIQCQALSEALRRHRWRSCASAARPASSTDDSRQLVNK